MKKHLLVTAIVLALVLCFSCGIFAADITSEQGNPNQYVVTQALQDYEGTDDLWIGTLSEWKADGGKVGDTDTFFVNGEAIHNDDIIIHNGKVGIVLSVGTRNPWGYPSGSVLDAGVVKDGVGGRDTIWSAELLINGWDSWAPDNCGVVKFDLVKYDFDAKKEAAAGLDAVKVSRIYNIDGIDFDVVTYYSIEKDASYANMFNQVTFKDEVWPEGTSFSQRFALTNKGDDGGAMFGGDPAANEAYGGMVACYGDTDKNTYFTAYVLPGNVERINAATGESLGEVTVEPSRVGGSVGYKCVRVDSKGNFSSGDKFDTFVKDEQRTYDTYLYIGSEPTPEGALALVAEIENANTVEVTGKAEPNATIVVKNGDSIFGWYAADKDGNYSFDLPKISGADYTTYVETAGKANGNVVALPVKTYTDVEENCWYLEALDQLTLIGSINGYPDGTFLPNTKISRAEFAKMIYNTVPEEYKTEGKAMSFSDVEDGAWYKEAVDFLSAEGIINGYPDGTFRPDNTITRAEMAVMIYRAAETDKDVVKNFSDVKPSSWYYDAVMALANGGVINGYPDGTFQPDKTASRAEAAKVLYMVTPTEIELAAGADKVKVTFNIEDKGGNPLYAKVDVLGAYPTVRYNGDSVFLAREAGKVEMEVAPGESTAVVYGEGHWFYSNPVEVPVNTDEKTEYDVTVDMVYGAAEGWLAGDLHHHANKNDAFADPEDAIPSMLAAGLDVAFITDHDFTVNNAKAFKLAEDYNMAGFIPSEEISCSWAHFNVIPLDEDSYNYFKDENQENHVMNQFGKLQEFVDQTHDAGAAITANHPWYSYGLFYGQSVNAIPGGYTDDFDSIEINACSTDAENVDAILSATALWTSYATGERAVDLAGNDYGVAEKAHYLVGGSDTHDVIYPGFAGEDYSNVRGDASYESGKVRTMAFVGDTSADVTANGLAYANAVVGGNSYTTYGPLLNVEQLPGEEYTAVDGVFSLDLSVESLANIKDIVVLTATAETDYEAAGAGSYCEGYLKYDASSSKMGVNDKKWEGTLDINVGADTEKTWVAVLVMDENGNYAITNPYWIVK